MRLFEKYRERRREISTNESVATLESMHAFFSNGENWAQHVYQGEDGGHCLVGAANHVRISPIDDAKHWLRQAIAAKTGRAISIEEFNDTRNSFEEIREILAFAKELARTAGASVPALVGDVQPPVRLALPSPAPVPVTARAPAVPAQRRAPASPPPPRSSEAPRRSLWDWGD